MYFRVVRQMANRKSRSTGLKADRIEQSVSHLKMTQDEDRNNIFQTGNKTIKVDREPWVQYYK